MRGKLEEELDQLTDEEIEKRLAAAVWVDDKRAAVPRYLEDKKPGRKKEAQAGELEIVRSAKDAAWAAVDVAKEANWSCFPSLHPFSLWCVFWATTWHLFGANCCLRGGCSLHFGEQRRPR
jgi:hypothetical protein